MPTVGHPQIFNVPDNTAAYAQLGQGGGQLLAALLKYYRNRGGGSYVSPTGATATISPAESQLSQMLAQRASQGQGSYTPRRLSFLGEVPVDVQRFLPRVQLQQAQGELAQLPFKQKNLEAETGLKEAQARRATSEAKFLEGVVGGVDGNLPLKDTPAVRDQESGQIRPAFPNEIPTMVISRTKNGIELKPYVAAQNEADVKKQQERSQYIKDSASDVLSTIEEVEKGISNFGLLGQVPSIPGTSRANWEANVNKLLSGKVLQVMNDMKEASRTGATGFGQLSNKELRVLQEASTALKRSLSPTDARRYLNDMKTSLQKIVDGDRSGSSPSASDGEDFSNYSDEELRAIAAGR